MLHEDRVLKTIDLLTLNARETLQKYAEWASTSSADVTFNLYDSIPSYTNNGTQGSAVIKPLTIPSFTSISSSIFGTQGTTSTRDIYWNFNFYGTSGWTFQQYSDSTVIPLLTIATDLSITNPSSRTFSNFSLDNVKIDYTYDTASLIANSTQWLQYFTNTTVSGKNSALYGTYETSIGSNHAITKSTTSNDFQYCNILNLFSGVITLAAFESNSQYILLKGTSKTFHVGNIAVPNSTYGKTFTLTTKSDISIYSSPINHYQYETVNNTAKIASINSSDTDTSNLLYYVYLGLSAAKIASKTYEGFQFFVKNNSSTSNTTVETVYDVWLEGGVDSYYSSITRDSSTYSDLDSKISNSLKKSYSSSNPYYLNVGTKGKLNLHGGDQVYIDSDSLIDIQVNGISAIKVSSDVVSIPNLSLPDLTSTTLSTINNLSVSELNSQITNLIPSSLSNPNSYNGSSITVGYGYDYVIKQLGSGLVWTTFNHDTTNRYSYVYYLENNTSSTSEDDYYNLYCMTFTSASTTETDFSFTTLPTPVLVTTVSSSIETRHIQANAGETNTYVSVFVPGTGVVIHGSSDRGASFSIITTQFKDINSIFKYDISISSAYDVTCGIHDVIWAVIEEQTQMVNKTFIGYANGTQATYKTTSTGTNLTNHVFAYDVLNSAVYTYTINPELTRGNTTYNQCNLLPSSLINNDYNNSRIIGYYDGTNYLAYVVTTYISNFKSSDSSLMSDKLSQKEVVHSFKITNEEIVQSTYYFGTSQNGSPLSFLHGKLQLIPTSSTSYSINCFVSSINRPTSALVQNFEGLYVFDPSSTANAFTSRTFTSAADITNQGFLFKSSVGYDYISSSFITARYTSFYKISSDYNFYIFKETSSNSSFTEILKLTSANTNFSSSSGEILPIYHFGFIMSNSSQMLFTLYSGTGTVSGSTTTGVFSDITTTAKLSATSLNYSNSLNSRMFASYIDTLGIDSFGYCDSTAILSNKSSKNIKYNISSYNLDVIDTTGLICLNEDSSDNILQLSSLTSSSSTSIIDEINYSSTSVNSSNNAIVGIKVDGSSTDYLTTSAPIVLSQVTSNSTQVFTRYGGLIKSFNSTFANTFGRFAIPVEMLSLFTKRAAASNLTAISRDDYTITFLTTFPSYFTLDASSNFIIATIARTKDSSYKVNSGHNLNFIKDSTFHYDYTGENVELSTANLAEYDYATYLVYDKTYNRTYMLKMLLTNTSTTPSYTSGKYIFNSKGEFKVNGNSMIISIDSKLLNPSDDNFDSYLSIINEKSNVVSLRVDYIEGLKFESIKNYSDGNSSLILGNSFINNQEVSC